MKSLIKNKEENNMHLKYSFIRFCNACLVVTLLLSHSIFAQVANLKGKVTDRTSKDGLALAFVVVKGTNLGTAADLDGNYFLKNIPAGNQTFIVSYIGYESDTVSINIPRDGTTLIRDFALKATAIEGEEVVVTAQAQGQVSAIQQQLASDKIVNIVSEQRIQQLPDFNAAQAISRLPGISTTQSSGEANKVVIRGMAPQYNAVNVSGISMAASGSNDRSVDLTMVTPYMIKSIEVYKSLTPDMDANAVGGVVNMNLREAPTGLKSDIMWQSGYTAKTGSYGNYRGIASVSNRFFDDAVGIYVLGNLEKYDRDADNMNAGYAVASSELGATFNPVRVNQITLNRHQEVRKRYGANLVLDYKFSTGVLRTINMVSQLIANYTDNNQQLNFPNNQIVFTNNYGENTTTSGVHSLELNNDFGFMSMELKFSGTYSKNTNPWSPSFTLQQTGGVSTGLPPIDTPPENLVNNISYNGGDLTYLTSVTLNTSLFKENNNMLKGDFKVPLNLGEAISGYLKFGGMYVTRTLANDQSSPYFDPRAVGVTTGTPDINHLIMDGITARYGLRINPAVGRFYASNFTSSNNKLYDSFLDDKFGRVFWAADQTVLFDLVNYVSGTAAFNAINAPATAPGGWFATQFQTLPNDYDYNERYGAGYLMTQLNYNQELNIVGGIRWENVESAYHAYNLLEQRDAGAQNASVREETVHPANHFVLPMIQVKFNPFSWADVRYSFTQTLARPDYRALTPHYTIGYTRNFVTSGNPNLKPAQSFNHDFMVSFHSNELGLLSFGVFYKEIKNFAYSTSYQLRAGKFTLAGRDSINTFNTLGAPPIEGAQLNTTINSPFIAYIRGIEFDFQTRFWYLPFPLDGLLLGFNYTHINSGTRYSLYVPDRVGGTRTNPIYVQVDSSRAGRLLLQPNDIANVFIGYDYEGFSLKLSFVYQGNSVSYIGGYPEADGYTDDYFRIDISARQLLPWYDMQVFLDVTNLNNRQNVSRQTTINGFTNQQNYGLTANLGIRLNLSM
jgi:TonB-dependent receptor